MVEFQNVTKTYRTKHGVVSALSEICLSISSGSFVSVTGPSGCGKSTLLMATGGLLHPSQGTVRVNEHDLYAMSSGERARLRAQNIGFVFQMFHLVPYLNVIENVLLGDKSSASDNGRAMELLERLNLADRATHKPSQLSTGERQRAAIARALLTQPTLVLADEPTGNLDTQNEAEVFQILRDYHQQGGTVIVVSHGTVADDYATRLIRMRAGRIEENLDCSIASLPHRQ